MKIYNANFKAFTLGILGLAAIYAAMLWLVGSTHYMQQPLLFSRAVSADLIFTAPLVYFLLIFRSSIPKITVIPVFVLSLFVGFYILPEKHQQYLDWAYTTLLPLAEVGVIVYVFSRVRKIIQEFRKSGREGAIDFLEILREVTFRVFGNRKVADIFSTEISVFYYAFFCRKPKFSEDNNYFSYHRENGLLAMISVFILIIGVETVGLHVVVDVFVNATVAWVLTGASLYSLLYLIAQYRASVFRPIQIGEKDINIRFGLMGNAKIAFNNISKIELSSNEPNDEKKKLKFSLLGGLGGHNVIIYLRNPSFSIGAFGIKTHFQILMLEVDDKEEFVRKTRENCNIE
ncbi:hypothetical protein [Xanthovirga aplysinae]|uniref:hypothetical protein n=1 Tax=Xanthovirga aplysinae TaxID=2529853 RepID=UPI0012BBD8C0|nr:hypothetical protein [Xanthovirga aplysinae]MTI33127.1 hypothetical protein [Xanthovirga aplysinae]